MTDVVVYGAPLKLKKHKQKTHHKIALNDVLVLSSTKSWELWREFLADEKISLERFRELLDDGASPDTYHPEEEECLIHRAHRQGRMDLVTLLVSKGADVNMADGRGRTLLQMACINSNHMHYAMFLALGSDVQLRDQNGFGPLQFAVEAGDEFLVRSLISLGEAVNDKNKDGMTSLHIAIEYGKPIAFVEFLLKEGSDVDATDDDGCTPLHRACAESHGDVVKLLIDYGSNVNTPDMRRRTPFYHALLHNNSVAAGVLGKYSCSHPDKADSTGWTCLHAAARNGDIQVLSELCERGWRIGCKDLSGWTPLHIAVFYLQEEAVAQLLRRDAPVFAKEKRGQTALDFAIEKKAARIISMLEEYRAKRKPTTPHSSVNLIRMGHMRDSHKKHDLPPPTRTVKMQFPYSDYRTLHPRKMTKNMIIAYQRGEYLFPSNDHPRATEDQEDDY